MSMATFEGSIPPYCEHGYIAGCYKCAEAAHAETRRLALAALDSCKTQVTVGDLSYHLHTTEELCALAQHLDKLKAGE